MNFDVDILSILKVITQQFCPGLYIVYRSDHGDAKFESNEV